MSSISAKTTAVIISLMTYIFDHSFYGIGAFQAQQIDDDYGDHGKWIRLCTLTSNGSSRLNLTMPCSVHVENERPGDDDVKTNANPVTGDEEEGSSNDHHPGGDDVKTGHSDEPDNGNSTVDRRGDTSVDDNDEGVSDAVEDDVSQETVVENVSDSEIDGNPGEEDAADEEVDDDIITVETESDGEGVGGGDKRDDLERRRRVPVATVMLRYLLDAKNKFYENIHYLLEMLRNSFLSARLNRRSRRDSIQRQTKPNTKRQADRKTHSVASVILEPSFERSLMTMSFLMFGVFVIQVVQRLMQTFQQSGEMTSMANVVPNYLPTVSSSIFNK